MVEPSSIEDSIVARVGCPRKSWLNRRSLAAPSFARAGRFHFSLGFARTVVGLQRLSDPRGDAPSSPGYGPNGGPPPHVRGPLGAAILMPRPSAEVDYSFDLPSALPVGLARARM
jgi:hypothetical protein